MPHKPLKKLGQNFLIDALVIHRILDELHPQDEQFFLEIGPGKGALTIPLLASEPNISLLAIELDRNLAKNLRRLEKEHPNFHVHEGDALLTRYDEISTNGRKIRVFGNLPYNISTPLMFRLFSYLEKFDDMLFMLQKELVERICAPPGSKTYGRLSVMTQYYCHTEHLFDLGPESFDPPPKVDSSLLLLTPRRRNHQAREFQELFAMVVKTAFSQRRKTLANSIKTLCSKEQLKIMGIPDQARPEQLSVEEYQTITGYLLGSPPGP